jgi:hypothetical protein
MMTDLYPLICANCRVAVEGEGYSDAIDNVTCPICGATDSFENATREAAEHEAEKKVAKRFDKLFAAFESRPLIKVTKNVELQKKHRFIRDEEAG